MTAPIRLPVAAADGAALIVRKVAMEDYGTTVELRHAKGERAPYHVITRVDGKEEIEKFERQDMAESYARGECKRLAAAGKF